MDKVLFQEIQKFRQPWLWAILIGSDLLMIYLILRFAFFESGEIDHAALIVLGCTLLLMALMSGSFFYTGLITQFRESGIHYRFKPFQRKFKIIRYQDLVSVEVKKYNPVKEYGGWGIRYRGGKKGKAYNVSGNIGIYFVFKSGEKFLLGTQKPEMIKKILQRLTEEGALTNPQDPDIKI